MQNKLLKVGITGGIGAGKSVVSKIFNILGVPVYDADTHAKLIMTQDPIVVDAIKKKFGEHAYLPDGQLNRAYLAKQVFQIGNKNTVISDIVHPAVALDFEKWSKSQINVPYVLKEAALLFESEAYKSLDYIITVLAPVKLRISRVLLRDPHRTKAEIGNIISIQMSEDEKISKSQFTITNSNSDLLIPQVLNIHNFLLEK